jgi:hypothetical protein
MQPVECPKCGSMDLVAQGGYVVCAYCRSKFVPRDEDIPPPESIISVESDIQALLRKCRDDPANSRRYANLILDIDPTNLEAMKYLDYRISNED